MPSVEFTVPGNAVPWARAGGHGHIRFTPAPQRSYMGVLRHYASEAMGDKPLFDGPCRLMVVATFQWPKSTPKKVRALGKARKKTKPDLDNLVKIVKDSLNGIVWTDDARVCDERSSKWLGEKPGLHVWIQEIGE